MQCQARFRIALLVAVAVAALAPVPASSQNIGDFIDNGKMIIMDDGSPYRVVANISKPEDWVTTWALLQEQYTIALANDCWAVYNSTVCEQWYADFSPSPVVLYTEAAFSMDTKLVWDLTCTSNSFSTCQVTFQRYPLTAPPGVLTCRKTPTVFEFRKSLSVIVAADFTVERCGSAVVVNTSETTIANVTLDNGRGSLQMSGITFRSNTDSAIKIVRGAVLLYKITAVNNTARVGAAINALQGFVGVNGSSFVNNGPASSADDGGAVYFAPGACLRFMNNSLFQNNVAKRGGAIYLPEVVRDCSAAETYNGTKFWRTYIVNDTFVNNTATESGGAVWANQLLENEGQIQVAGSDFNDNKAGQMGGAVFGMANHGLILYNSRFVRNTAGVAGGAVFFGSNSIGFLRVNGSIDYLDVDMPGMDSYFVNNSVYLDGESASIYSATFKSNWLLKATYGGGGAIAATGEVQVTVANASLQGNYASTLGGGLLCVRCINVDLRNVSVIDNTALVGGGGVALPVPVGPISLEDVLFAQNTALAGLGLLQDARALPPSTQFDPATLACSMGGGGGLCTQTLARELNLTSIVFDANRADFGGAWFLDHSLCDRLLMWCNVGRVNVTVRDNNFAQKDGNGIYWASGQGGRNVSLIDTREGDLNSWPRSINLGTDPTKLQYVSQQLLNLTMTFTDEAQELIRAVNRDVMVELQSLSGSSIVRGSAGLTRTGDLTLRDMAIIGSADVHPMILTASVDGLQLTNQTFNITLRQCKLPEVTVNEFTCTTCNISSDSSFTFNPDNTTCDACPVDSTCPQGTLVPLDGYWISSPRSPQLHICPLKDACKYTNRTAQLEDGAVALLDVATQDLTPEQIAAFTALECSPGHQGNVCGACDTGGGWARLRRKCVQCPSAAQNWSLYFLMRLVDLLLVSALIVLRLRRRINKDSMMALRTGDEEDVDDPGRPPRWGPPEEHLQESKESKDPWGQAAKGPPQEFITGDRWQSNPTAAGWLPPREHANGVGNGDMSASKDLSSPYPVMLSLPEAADAVASEPYPAVAVAGTATPASDDANAAGGAAADLPPPLSEPENMSVDIPYPQISEVGSPRPPPEAMNGVPYHGQLPAAGLPQHPSGTTYNSLDSAPLARQDSLDSSGPAPPPDTLYHQASLARVGSTNGTGPALVPVPGPAGMTRGIRFAPTTQTVATDTTSRDDVDSVDIDTSASNAAPRLQLPPAATQGTFSDMLSPNKAQPTFQQSARKDESGMRGWRRLLRRARRPPDAGSVFEALVLYSQMLGLLARVTASYPEFTANFLSYTDITASTTSFIALECLLPSSPDGAAAFWRILISVLIPLIMMVLFQCFWIIWFKTGRSSEKVFSRYMFERFFVSVSQICLFYYTTLTSSVLSLFSCVTLDKPTSMNGIYSANLLAVGSWWTQNYDVPCLQGYQLAWALGLGVPSLLLYSLGVPLMISLFLRMHKQELVKVRFRERFGMLYENYRLSHYYWSTSNYLRLLFLNVAAECLQYIGPGPQFITFMGILTISVVLHIIHLPYRHRLLNFIHALPIFAVLATSYMALAFVDETASDTWLLVVGVLILFINAFTVALLLMHLVWSVEPVVRRLLAAYKAAKAAGQSGQAAMGHVQAVADNMKEGLARASVMAAEKAKGVRARLLAPLQRKGQAKDQGDAGKGKRGEAQDD